MKLFKVVYSSFVLCGAAALVTTSLVVRNKPKNNSKDIVIEEGERPSVPSDAPYKILAPQVRNDFSFNLFEKYYEEGKTNDFYNIYKDVEATNVDGTIIKAVVDDSYLYFLVENSSTDEIAISYGNKRTVIAGDGLCSMNMGATISLNTSYLFTIEKSAKKHYVNVHPVRNDKQDIVLYSPDQPNRLVTRNLYSAKYTNTAITIDGNLDSKYLTSDLVEISSLCQGKTDVTANGYILWDDNYLYAFFEVTDDDVDTTSSATNFENDTCEFWLDTCRSLPFQNQTWGYEGGNRSVESYCGEGGFKIRAGQTSITGGQEWMYDNTAGIYREGTYKKTSVGYNCEFKIGLGSFASVSNKENEILSFNMLVTDGNNCVIAKGKIGNNFDSNIVWAWGGPSHMDHLKLVK